MNVKMVTILLYYRAKPWTPYNLSHNYLSLTDNEKIINLVKIARRLYIAIALTYNYE